MPGDDIEKKVRNSEIGLLERWALLEPWLDQVRNTSYWQSLKLAMRKIHGIDDMTGDTIQALQDSFAQKASDPGYKRFVLKELCHIERSINCRWDELSAPDEFFVYTGYPGDYVMPYVTVEQATLAEYCQAYKKEYQAWRGRGIAALKVTLAYERSLYFEDIPFEEAEALFNQCEKDKRKFPKKLQDYMMHYALSLANEDKFVVQIHTGLQEGMYNDIENSNPMLLKNLFRKYPDLTFDLFHIGYPYDRELITLAKYHPNVYIDMCWAHIISPHASREFFREALDVIPYTKIFGFGGDYIFFDGVAGHLEIAKQNICEVLAEKIDRGEYDMALAEKILRAVFYGNAKRVFNL